MALNLVVIGPPGAGKGTQAERFARQHGIPKISTGDILREAVSGGTPLGLQVKSLMDNGKLVSDDLMIDIVRDRLAKPDVRRGFVLDGFPRTAHQAEALDEILEGRDALTVVEIRVPDEELVRRVRARRICRNCGRLVSAFSDQTGESDRCANCGGELVARSDDAEAVVRDRLKVYWQTTKPMIAFYQGRPTYRIVDGAQSPEQVRDDLVAAVASALGRPAADLGAGVPLMRPEKNA